jgi:uncharacterized protein
MKCSEVSCYRLESMGTAVPCRRMPVVACRGTIASCRQLSGRAALPSLVKAVANAGPLIHLSWIDQLNLLPILFDEVLVPLAVQDEVLRASPDVPGVPALRAAFASEWLNVQTVTDRSAFTNLTVDLDLGESEAIVLVREVVADLLLLDERRGREIAERQSLPLMGPSASCAWRGIGG